MNGSTHLQSKDATQDSGSVREKRRHPRFHLNLPIEFRVMNAPHVLGAMIVNVSETGLLIQSPNGVPAGTRLNIAVLFSQGHELGLRFIQMLEEDRQKLKHLLSNEP